MNSAALASVPGPVPLRAGAIACFVIIAVSLLLPIVFAVTSEKNESPVGFRFGWAALMALYGVCVGAVCVALTHFRRFSAPVARVVSVSAGVPAFFLAAKISEG